jgi:membrane protein required for colicin V production
MTWVDYTILGIILLSVIISLFRGLIREVMALVVWVAAFAVAFMFTDDVEGLLSTAVDVPSARLAISFGLLFLVTLIIGGLLNYVLGQLIEKTGLTGTDRFFGIFFGLARAGVLLTAIVMLAGLTPAPQDSWWQQSKLLPVFESLALYASSYLPEDVHQYLKFDSLPEVIEEVTELVTPDPVPG